MFDRLLDKFDNFCFILNEWYRDKKYYEYLKELWIKYPCLEDLNQGDIQNMEELENIMDSFGINFRNWPEEIKCSFQEIIKDVSETRLFALKNIIEEKFFYIKKILDELIYIKKYSENWTKKENNIENNISKNALEIATKIASQITEPLSAVGVGEWGFSKISENLEKTGLKRLIKKKFMVNKKQATKLSKSLMKYIEKNELSGEKFFAYKGNKLDAVINCNDGKVENISNFKKYKSFFGNKFVIAVHTGLSFINLFWNIKNLQDNLNESDLIKDKESKLNNIIEQFEYHKELIKNLPTNLEEKFQAICDILKLIQKDRDALIKLIDEINQRIEFQDNQKDKSIKGILYSLGLGLFGGVGTVLTLNPMYMVNSFVNVISLVISAKNLSDASKYIKEYRDLLKRATDKQIEIQKVYDGLVKELTKILDIKKGELIEQFHDGQPQFRLDPSIKTTLYKKDY